MERNDALDPSSRLYLGGLNDPFDAAVRFEDRQRKVERAIQRIESASSYEKERQGLVRQLGTAHDQVAQRVLKSALEQLDNRLHTIHALRVDLERVEARQQMIAQSLATVRDLLIRDSVGSGDPGDTGGLALLSALNEDLAQDAILAQEAEAEHILRSISP